jgi:hypothetical protein
MQRRIVADDGGKEKQEVPMVRATGCLTLRLTIARQTGQGPDGWICAPLTLGRERLLETRRRTPQQRRAIDPHLLPPSV